MKTQIIILSVFLVVLLGCNKRYEEGTFGYDIDLLKPVTDLTVLQDGNAMIAVSGAYQGRVFTSTSMGLAGKSYGWFNRKIIKEGNSAELLSKLGGEGRMWFGPEIGKYSIFFNPDTEQTANNIHISPELNTRLFKPIDQSKNSVTYGNEMSIRNANGYVFSLFAKRKITLKSQEIIEQDLGIQVADQISTVAFSAETWITNKGNEAWTKENGLLSIWDIGCMLPSENSTVIIPLQKDTNSVTVYFTPIDSSRIKIIDQVAYYKADAKYMNKIGVKPELCTGTFGSYSPELKLLNIVKYNFENDSLYANCLWGHKLPYKGDVINVFNGEVNASIDRDWPFFELESLSSTKELQPEEDIKHMQSIYHFEGSEEDLDKISKKVLGVSLDKIRNVFK